MMDRQSKPSAQELDRHWQAQLNQPGVTMTVAIVADVSSLSEKREALPEKYRDEAQENTDYTAILNGDGTGTVQDWVLFDLLASQYQQLLTDFGVQNAGVRVRLASQTGSEGEVHAISSAVVEDHQRRLSLEIFLDTNRRKKGITPR